MQRKANAVWQGDVKSGQGSLSTECRVLDKAQYSFSTRFENGIGTNPEELLAAAHAGCFAMALSAQLGKAGLTPQRLDVTATITLEKVGEHHAITKSHLDLLAHVPGAQQSAFEAAVSAVVKTHSETSFKIGQAEREQATRKRHDSGAHDDT